MQFRGAGDWHNPRLLRKQPCKRDLSRRLFRSFCDLTEQIDQGLIRFPRLRRKARECAAQVRTVEPSVFVDLSREKASAQRAKRNKTDSEFLERRQDFLLRLSPPQRIFVLDCSDRL